MGGSRSRSGATDVVYWGVGSAGAGLVGWHMHVLYGETELGLGMGLYQLLPGIYVLNTTFIEADGLQGDRESLRKNTQLEGTANPPPT